MKFGWKMDFYMIAFGILWVLATPVRWIRKWF